MPDYDITVKGIWAAAESFTITANAASLNGVSKYWTTFCHGEFNYQLPAGAQAFYMKNDKSLYLLGDGDKIPAGCAVIIMSDTGSITLTKIDSASVTSPTDNKLAGTAAQTAVSSLGLTGKKVYVLNKGTDDELGFFEYSGTTIPANKAYYVE
ncbi:MAG: hypothetical protein J6U14_08695, partial [Bacteroidaceae bacterium]|nr:hypothetical protein [Bacteroidaceae bacterium]